MSAHGFKSVYWGPDDAKGDSELLNYFVSSEEFEGVRSGEKRYVIGRKGAGKTAVIERIRLEAESDALMFFSKLTLRDFPIQDLKDMRDKSARDKSQYVPAWLFLIYVELAKIAATDNGVLNPEIVEDLRYFLSSNNLNSNVGFSDTVKELKGRQSKLKVSAKWLEGEYGESSSREAMISVHYQKIVKVLGDQLRQVRSESTYWLFMDELDEGYRAGDPATRLLLLALLRAVEDSAIQLAESVFSYRPVLVLRSDIFDRLEDNDLNKLDDYLVRLKWSSADNNSGLALKRMVAARIVNSLGGNPADAWGNVVIDGDHDLPAQVDSVWSYMVNRTYERPRDIIKFLKYCNQYAKAGMLTFKQVNDAEREYSSWLYRELRDEIHSYLPCWRESLQCITRIGTWKFNKEVLESILLNDRNIKAWLEQNGKHPDDIIETLFDFGIIGNLDQRRWLFKYKDDDLAWNDAIDLIVHFGLNKKLRLVAK